MPANQAEETTHGTIRTSGVSGCCNTSYAPATPMSKSDSKSNIQNPYNKSDQSQDFYPTIRRDNIEQGSNSEINIHMTDEQNQY